MAHPRAHIYEWDGHSLTLKEWSTKLGVQVRTLYQRLQTGDSWDRVFTSESLVNPAKPNCAVKTCQKKAFRSDQTYCRIHNDNLRRYGDPEGEPRTLTYKGKRQSLYAWTQELDIGYGYACKRYDEGMNAEDVLFPQPKPKFCVKCGDKRVAKGLCQKHYDQQRRGKL